MKKIICLMLIFSILFSGCSRWKVEIVDPTKPVENEQELVVSEEEKADLPDISDFTVMAINAEEDFYLDEEYMAGLDSCLKIESWEEVSAKEYERESFSDPVTMFSNGSGRMTVSAEGEYTLIQIERAAKATKCYLAPKNVAYEVENIRIEAEKEIERLGEEPKIEDFGRITLYSEDGIYVYYEFSDEELAEWLSIIRPESWKEDITEREGGSISDPIMLSGNGAGMYLGYDIGNETALIKYGYERNLSKIYIMPEGTLEKAKEFEKRMIRENPNVLTYPECNYDMSAEAFINRENDDYILWLDELMLCCQWGEGKEFSGFESYKDLGSKSLFNIFMFVFDYCSAGYEDNLTKAAWYDSSDEKYHIFMGDIYTILRKYLVVNGLDMEETSVNYEFDEEKNEIIFSGGYGVTMYRGETRKVVSVTDKGDGTITAVIESHVYLMDDEDNMFLSEKPEIRRTMVLRPGYFRCVVESLKIENTED
ncbi:MAG: hypothetical protein E7479_03390 [Ruminococcaceae bacterium]|nr:hypothetical protein [Oscillospiraceae bacterium]